jgi:transcriptional regulator with XRE-family HTH domain
MTIGPEQCRAARGLVNWSQDALAAASSVSKATIANFELGKSAPINATRDALRRALEAAGVEFIAENGGGPGVRLRKGKRRKASKPEPIEPQEEAEAEDPGPNFDYRGMESTTEPGAGISRVRDPLNRRR